MGTPTTALGSLLQCLATLSVKKFFLISNLNLSWCNLRPSKFLESLGESPRVAGTQAHRPYTKHFVPALAPKVWKLHFNGCLGYKPNVKNCYRHMLKGDKKPLPFVEASSGPGWRWEPWRRVARPRNAAASLAAALPPRYLNAGVRSRRHLAVPRSARRWSRAPSQGSPPQQPTPLPRCGRHRPRLKPAASPGRAGWSQPLPRLSAFPRAGHEHPRVLRTPAEPRDRQTPPSAPQSARDTPAPQQHAEGLALALIFVFHFGFLSLSALLHVVIAVKRMCYWHSAARVGPAAWQGRGGHRHRLGGRADPRSWGCPSEQRFAPHHHRKPRRGSHLERNVRHRHESPWEGRGRGAAGGGQTNPQYELAQANLWTSRARERINKSEWHNEGCVSSAQCRIAIYYFHVANK